MEQPEELTKAKKLLREGNYEEALNTIQQFKKKIGITDEEKLSALILEGKINEYTSKIQEAVNLGEVAYKLSKKIGYIQGEVKALLLKSNVYFLGEISESLNIIQEAENLINSLEKEPLEYIRERASILFMKGWIYQVKGDYDKSLELALLSLSLRKKLGKKMGIASTYNLICRTYFNNGENEQALDYATKSLALYKEMNSQVSISSLLSMIGIIKGSSGELDQGLGYMTQALEISEISFMDKFNTYSGMGSFHMAKGELDKALKCFEQALAISDSHDFNHLGIEANWFYLGKYYLFKGDYEKAIEFLKRNLENIDRDIFYSSLSIYYLVLIHLDLNLREEAKRYLSRLKELTDKSKSKRFSLWYQLANALVLKESGRTRNRYKAEKILVQIVEGEILNYDIYILALISLCDFLLEELENSNEPEVLDEINPYLSKLLEIADKQHSYSTMAETKLLQGRLALIKFNLDDARHFLSTAQKIADENGLIRLAQKISQEHDNLLEELETWQTFKKTKTSMSKRLKLASVNGVMDRMLGKRAVEPTEIVEEEPILLLIMDNAGNTFFNHIFINDWDYEDTFSAFMSAFNSFSSEIFSNPIDRIKIKDNLILIHPIEPFLVCYVIKGQSYSALKKLDKFAVTIRTNPEIWKSLQKSTKTSKMLDLNNPPAIGDALSEIFSI